MNVTKKLLVGCGGCAFLFIIGIIFLGTLGNKAITKLPEVVVTPSSQPVLVPSSPVFIPSPTYIPTPTIIPSQNAKCDPNYSGACVPIDSDVDCAGGSGNGPSYVRGPVYVIGRDIYGLDRDHDGVGCE